MSLGLKVIGKIARRIGDDGPRYALRSKSHCGHEVIVCPDPKRSISIVGVLIDPDFVVQQLIRKGLRLRMLGRKDEALRPQACSTERK